MFSPNANTRSLVADSNDKFSSVGLICVSASSSESPSLGQQQQQSLDNPQRARTPRPLPEINFGVFCSIPPVSFLPFSFPVFSFLSPLYSPSRRDPLNSAKILGGGAVNSPSGSRNSGATERVLLAL